MKVKQQIKKNKITNILDFFKPTRKFETIKDRYRLDKVFGLYNELSKDENLINIKNLSIDFIVQNNSSIKEFKSGLSNFDRTFKTRKYFKLSNGKYLKGFERGIFSLLTIDSKTNHNNLSASFFTDDSKNEWMINEILRILDLKIPLEIFEGAILVKDSNEYKIIFNDKYMNRNIAK